MNIDEQTMLDLIGKIKFFLEKNIENNENGWYCCSEHFQKGKRLIVWFQEKDEHINVTLTSNGQKIKVELDLCDYEYFLKSEKQNWFQKIFFPEIIDYNDRVYQETKKLLDYAELMHNRKTEKRFSKTLNEFLQK